MAKKMAFDSAVGAKPKKAKAPKSPSSGPVLPAEPKQPVVQAYAQGGIVRGAGAAIKGKKYSC